MRRLADDGCALLICSTDMLELAEVCNRVMIMRRGTVVPATVWCSIVGSPPRG